MKQTKLESHLESGVNIATGFVISWCVWMWVIVPLVAEGLVVIGPAGDALVVTMIFTVTSYLRSYVWRRFFNAGIHRVIHTLVKGDR